jgi:hypothetical protein
MQSCEYHHLLSVWSVLNWGCCGKGRKRGVWRGVGRGLQEQQKRQGKQKRGLECVKGCWKVEWGKV